MSSNNVKTDLLITTIAFIILPTTLLVMFVWAPPMEVVDLTGLKLFPAFGVFILALILGVLFATTPTSDSDDRFIRSPGLTSELSVSSWLSWLVLVCSVGALSGLIGAFAGEMTKYSVLFWICAAYGAALIKFYDLSIEDQALGSANGDKASKH
ncbi:hypothetical protein [Halorhabdus sp. BNX81]|uniref:hypothetical protein n=1 Tax=Halorhabdus sp. BNX81 TaxID=2980181 RepID=UPI0023DD11F4|nr:hypothetical protein [Halorhabdus sp. BNX81]